MSKVPYLDRLGEAFDEALRARPATQRVRPGWAVAIAAFVVVMLAGGAWWLLSPTGDLPVTASSTTTTVASDPGLPVTWARSASLEGDGGASLTFSGVAATPGGFVAAGTEVDDGTPSGVLFTSDDGIEWSEATRVERASLHDVTSHGDTTVAVGMRGDEQPLAVVSSAGGSWTAYAIAPARPGHIVQANAVAAHDGGFVAVGIDTDTEGGAGVESRRLVVWTSPDGATWEAAAGTDGYEELGIGDVTAHDGMLLIPGLVSAAAEARTTAVVWVSRDARSWERVDLPTLHGEGFVGASQVAFGPAGWVAAGFDAAGAAAWVSADGRRWEPISDPAFESTTGDMRANGILATASGYTMVGMSSDLPYFRHVVWTSPDAGSWTRYDLTDPAAETSSAVAFSLAARDLRIVAVGTASTVAGAPSVAAAWVSPAPPQLVASVPLQDEPNEPPSDELAVTVLPPTAAAASAVWIRGRVPSGQAGFRDLEVWLVGDGAPFRACTASLQGRNFGCRLVPADLEPVPGPGLYRVAIGDPSRTTEATLEIFPPDVEVVTMSGGYSPVNWPLVLNIVVSNRGGSPVDLGGWTIGDSRVESSRYAIAAGTVLEPGQSFILDFSAASIGGTCPESTPLHVYWCRVLGFENRVQGWDESDHLWRGGDVELRDPLDEVRAVWGPGS